jgi:hypothetical protein
LALQRHEFDFDLDGHPFALARDLQLVVFPFVGQPNAKLPQGEFRGRLAVERRDHVALLEAGPLRRRVRSHGGDGIRVQVGTGGQHRQAEGAPLRKRFAGVRRGLEDRPAAGVIEEDVAAAVAGFVSAKPNVEPAAATRRTSNRRRMADPSARQG